MAKIILFSIVSFAISACSQSNHDMADMKEMGVYHTNESIDSSSLRSLLQPTNFQVISSLQSVKPTLKTTSTVKARGYISLDERRNEKIAARVSGRIEKLFVKYNLQRVNAGDKVMELYSPELNTYQEELLYLVKSHSDQNLIDKAEEKLRLLGITQIQIDNIKRTGQTFYVMTIYSQQGGYVFFKQMSASLLASLKKEADGMIGMNEQNEPATTFNSDSQQLREGDYINKGDILFWLNDLQIVWAMIAIDNSHMHEIKLGTKASVVGEQYKQDTIHTSISFIEPQYQPNQKFGMARIYLNNVNNRYKINSLMNAEINIETKPMMTVPYSSVLFLGKRELVWVMKGFTQDRNRIYEAREIRIGTTEDGDVEIKEGLNADEEVAINAGYLMDRESLIIPKK